MRVPEYDRGVREGLKFAVTWLHQQAREMNDPWAKAVLNTAAFGLGVEGKQGSLEAKAKILELALARSQPAPQAFIDAKKERDEGWPGQFEDGDQSGTHAGSRHKDNPRS